MPATDPRLEHLRDIHHVPEFDRLEIQHFFEVYKELEPGKSVEGASWVGRVEAEREIARVAAAVPRRRRLHRRPRRPLTPLRPTAVDASRRRRSGTGAVGGKYAVRVAGLRAGQPVGGDPSRPAP